VFDETRRRRRSAILRVSARFAPQGDHRVDGTLELPTGNIGEEDRRGTG
jgi:hypothetical protein